MNLFPKLIILFIIIVILIIFIRTIIYNNYITKINDSHTNRLEHFSQEKKAVKLKQKAHKKGHQFSSHSSGKTWKGDKYKHRLKKGKNKSLKESMLSFSEFIQEENKPTNTKLWSKCKSAAKRKFDVYPSAYANAWAAKCYKKKRKGKGSGWKKES